MVNVKVYIKDLKRRLKYKMVVSILIMFQIVLFSFGTAWIAFSFDSIFNDRPEYLRYFNDETWRLKKEFNQATLNIDSLLANKLVPSEKGVENNLAGLSEEVRGVSKAIEGFSDAFNKQKYSIADSHLSTKRVLFFIFSFFIIFYVKFLIDLYKYNTNQMAHEQAVLDALRICIKNEENLPPSIDIHLLKEILPFLHIQFGGNEKTSLALTQLLSKSTGQEKI